MEATVKSNWAAAFGVTGSIIFGFLRHDVKDEVVNLGRGVRGTGRAVHKITKTSFDMVKCEKKRKAAIIQLCELKHTPKKLKSAIKGFTQQIRLDLEGMNSREKTIYLASLSAYITSLAGGAYLGNQAPDYDMKKSLNMNIGDHRNAGFHSVLIAVAIRLMLRLVERLVISLDEHGQLSRPDLVLKVRTCLAMARGGVSAGVAVHLSIDGTVQGSKAVLFGEYGSMVSDTLIDDKAWLLVNAFFCGLSGDELAFEKKAQNSQQKPAWSEENGIAFEHFPVFGHFCCSL